VIRVIDLENTLEIEPNDTLAQATLATVPGALNGIIEKPGDVDHSSSPLKRGKFSIMRVYARDTLALAAGLRADRISRERLAGRGQ